MDDPLTAHGTPHLVSTARPPRHRGEPELRAAIVQMLRAHGIAVKTSVPCAAGAADIVTVRQDVIFEVKYGLSRSAIYQGVGQLLCYRGCINAQARVILIGYATPDTEALRPHVATLGVELVTWRDEVARPETAANDDDDAATLHLTGARAIPGLLPQRSVLRWNVADLAQARGYLNVPRLARAMGTARQALYAIWRDEAIQVALITIARLARVLDADVGDWFEARTEDRGLRTEGNGISSVLSPSSSSLVWNVRARMEAIGLNPVDLTFDAQLYSGSTTPILDGVAQAVHVETLGKLAQALDRPDAPFRIGDLFRWASATHDED